MHKKIIELKAPSNSDNLRCEDGEVENGGWLFPIVPDNQDSSGNQESPDKISPQPGDSLFALPAGARVVIFHDTDYENREWNAICQMEDGSLRFYLSTLKSVRSIENTDGENIIEAVAIGRFVVFLTRSGLRFIIWNSTSQNYDWLGPLPQRPTVDFQKIKKSLPPYSYVDGDSPELIVTVASEASESGLITEWLAGTDRGQCPEFLKDRVKKSVAERLKVFMTDCKKYNLFFNPVYCMTGCSTRGADWIFSDPVFTMNAENLNLKIDAAVEIDGGVRMRLILSDSPYLLQPRFIADFVPKQWASLIEDIDFFVSPEIDIFNPDAVSDALYITPGERGFQVGALSAEQELPALYKKIKSIGFNGDFSDFTLPELLNLEGDFKNLTIPSFSDKGISFIREINSRLVVVKAGEGRMTANSVAVSHEFLPMAVSGESVIAGERLINITHSLRSLSSGQFGDFPLYGFARDGIRALTPRNGSFVDVQLISRDVALSSDSFAPLPDSVAFITARGVMEIASTSVNCLSAKIKSQTGVDWKFQASDHLAYDYVADCLILYNTGLKSAMLYYRKTSTWLLLDWCPENHSYLWPRLFLQVGRAVRILDVEPPSLYGNDVFSPYVVPGGEMLVKISTRPIKFGAPFAVKKLKRVELLWPEGERLPFSVYGAMTLPKWHLLGHSNGQDMILAGSGWRYFKFDLNLRQPEEMTEEKIIQIPKPLIMCGYEIKE